MNVVNVPLERLGEGLAGVVAGIVPTAFPKSIRDTSVYLSSAAKRRFDAGVDPDGQPWAPLKRQRRRRRDRKAKGGSGQKVLRDTGILMASMSGGAGADIRMGDTYLVQGTSVHYGLFHQFGTVKMVARPFAGINARDLDIITKIATANVIAGTP